MLQYEMPRKGRSFEALVSVLEKAASTNPNLEVHSPYFAIDRVTGKRREHDVVVILKQDHHETKIALECRQRSAAVIVNQVEEFSRKCEDTGIDKCIIVSSKGFTKTARKKAEFLGMRCFTLKQAEELGWLIDNEIRSSVVEIPSISWTFFLKQNPSDKPQDFTVFDPSGEILTVERLNRWAHAEYQANPATQLPPLESRTITIRFPLLDFELLDHATKEKHPLSHADVAYFVKVTTKSEKISKFVYSDDSKANSVAEIGVAPIRQPGLDADLLFISGAKGISVSLKLNKPFDPLAFGVSPSALPPSGQQLL